MATAAARTGYVWHERYMWHDTGSAVGNLKPGGLLQPSQHWEHPETKRRLNSLLEVSGLRDELVTIKPRYATEEEICWFHTRTYVDRIKAMSDADGGDAGEHTYFGPGSYEIAKLSLGGCFAGVDAVMKGHVRNVYALVRPPGHHAEADTARGFCIFANVALTAMYARKTYGLKRVAVVDWDVHHGNGTEHAFYNDPSVLFISIHQNNRYPPNSGAVTDRGTGAGEGFNINIPLPAGSGGAVYRSAFSRVVEPALTAFQPELILISCGFDAGAFDPLAQMMLNGNDFRFMARTVIDTAERICNGRIVFCHEGGYSPQHVPFCGHAVIEELSNSKIRVEDPYANSVVGWGGSQDIEAHQESCIAAAAESVSILKTKL